MFCFSFEKELIESIDAMDNGISQYETIEVPKYRVSTHLGCRVARLNSDWNESADANSSSLLSTLEMERFKKAMALCGNELTYFIQHGAFSFLPARELVTGAVLNRMQTHSSGQIIELSKFCPWTDHLYDIEQQLQSFLYLKETKQHRLKLTQSRPKRM
ncbi:hypothetical protein RFI_05228 [Reticulomyxa filosa]|uniref:Uncharacterized protein n=1 Tax=Reticulomyxa filosa TaxID=46433 RepID=X6P1A4_RETFI|nr:hypothetical protein RFI_05228 [Reticulomyxa filosa]|eukprot:ETO31888.1 hypothetical protein RFI_05228 [Reticulomyxa filosa]